MKIVPAQKRETEAIATLINSAYRGNIGWTLEHHLVGGERITAQDIERIIYSDTEHLFTAYEEETLLATVALEETENGVVLGLFAVEPCRQNQGIGKKVLHFAETYSKEVLQSKRIEISVISIREEILAYYERRGYRPIKEDYPFPEAYVPFLKQKDITMTVLEKILHI